MEDFNSIISDTEIEVHPWPPFYNRDSRILIMGTFPPQPKRWSMNFYYPNPTNDFWPMMALIFFGDRNALNVKGSKQFDLDAIKELLTTHGIAMNDTGHKIRRLKGNASDKYLEIIEPVDLEGLLNLMPDCHTIATTGEKAAGVVARLTDTEIPKMGDFVTSSTGLDIWRMPSTSRAYPLKLEKKAEYYAEMFRKAGILP
ncbi:MAG: uracil-DNA glycosylase family protein [Duncaniella sp.]|nr:uracil-DNA glycosylase family protein [Duncaniella sp.]